MGAASSVPDKHLHANPPPPDGLHVSLHGVLLIAVHQQMIQADSPSTFPVNSPGIAAEKKRWFLLS